MRMLWCMAWALARDGQHSRGRSIACKQRGSTQAVGLMEPPSPQAWLASGGRWEGSESKPNNTKYAHLRAARRLHVMLLLLSGRLLSQVLQMYGCLRCMASSC